MVVLPESSGPYAEQIGPGLREMLGLRIAVAYEDETVDCDLDDDVTERVVDLDQLDPDDRAFAGTGQAPAAVGRRMADPSFAADQRRRRYEGTVGEINRWIDELRDPDGRGWMPHIAPMHAGTDAKVLSILSDPGPGAREDAGSGFLCIESNDRTADM